MPEDVLRTLLQQILEMQQGRQATIGWQGGEPTLMGLGFYECAVSIQNELNRGGVKIVNALQTNGMVLDDKWCRFFKQHEFLVGLSLDGEAGMHNANRRDKSGSPTFERVVQSVYLLQKYGVDFNILTCVSSANVRFPLRVYRFLRDQVGAKFIQFIPIVERKTTSRDGACILSDHSIKGKQYGEFLIAVFDEWVRRDVGRVFVQLFDTALGKWLGARGGLCVFDETCGRSLVAEHNGDLYSCDHFVDPEHRLGNILETHLTHLVSSQEQKRFGSNKRETLPGTCLECDVLFACNGGCPKNRVVRTYKGEPGLNHLCAGYKAFFRHVDQPMRIMADLVRQRRSASEVMSLLHAGD